MSEIIIFVLTVREGVCLSALGEGAGQPFNFTNHLEEYKDVKSVRKKTGDVCESKLFQITNYFGMYQANTSTQMNLLLCCLFSSDEYLGGEGASSELLY